MSLKFVLGYALYVGTLVLAKPVEPPSASSVPDSAGGAIELHPPSDPVALTLEPTSASSDSITWPNVTGGNSIHVQCDGVSYGFDLDIVDCEEAKAYVPPSPDQVQWAERHTGWQKQIFPLPYRSMGNKASCYVEPILISGATSARANLNEVRNAAAAIRNRCVFGGKLQGGIAINIGGDNNLAVIMGAYKPTSRIQCIGPALAFKSCEDVLIDMPATNEAEIFGLPKDPTAKVLLPQAVESDDNKCLLLIFTTSAASETTTWYEVWEATIALWSTCVRHRQAGSMSGLGQFF